MSKEINKPFQLNIANNQESENSNYTEEAIPRLVLHKVEDKREKIKQSIGKDLRAVKLTGFAGKKPSFDVWLSDINLKVLEWFDFQAGAALINQGAVGNCWLVAPMKALLDSRLSVEFFSYALQLDEQDEGISFSFPSADPSKRLPIQFKGDHLAHYYSPAVFYLFQGMSEQFDNTLQPYKAADKRRSEDTQFYERVLQDDITATLNGHFEEEPMYRIFKYLSEDFVYISNGISTSRLDFLLSTHFAYKGEVLGVIAFSNSFTTTPVQLNSDFLSETQSMKIQNRHAYYLKSFNNEIVTIMNPHHLSEQIHISLSDVQMHFETIFLAKVPSIKSDSNIYLSRTLPIYISYPKKQGKPQYSPAQIIPFETTEVTLEPSLYPYLPGYRIYSQNDTFYVFNFKNNLLAYNVNTKSLLGSVASTSTSFMDTEFKAIDTNVFQFSGDHIPSLLSFYQGYLCLESTDLLQIQAPKTLTLPKDHNVNMEFETQKPLSIQILNGCEITILELNNDVIIFTDSDVISTTTEDFQFFYSIDSNTFNMKEFSEDELYTKNGVYVTYWYGEFTINNFGEAQSIIIY